MFHCGEPLTETVWEKLMPGRNSRKYSQAVREFPAAYELEKSVVRERRIEARRANLPEMMDRPLRQVRLCALRIDATPFAGQQMVAALGIAQDGKKMIWDTPMSYGKRHGSGRVARRLNPSRAGFHRTAATCR
jgi:hypothetical protein